MPGINIPTGSGVRVSAVKETSQGVLPVTPAFKQKRVDSIKPNFARDLLKSSELTTSRQTIAARLGMVKASYQYAGNLVLGAWDDDIENAMNSTWETAGPTFSGSLQVIGASQSIVRSVGSWITDKFMPGDYVSYAGDTVTANNSAILQINSVTATTITAAVIRPAGAALVDSSAGTGRTVAVIGKRVTVGPAGTSNPASMAIEHYIPGNGVRNLFVGMCVDKLSLTAKPNAMAHISFDFIGLNSVLGTTDNGSSYPAAPTNDPMDAFTAPLYLDGVAAGNVTSMTLNFGNGRKPAEGVIGSKLSPAIIEGTNETTVDFTAYFSDAVLANKFRNEVVCSMDVPFFDVNGTDFIKLRFGRLKITDASEDIKLNAGVLLNLKGLALPDPSTITQTGTQYGTNVVIQRSNLV